MFIQSVVSICTVILLVNAQEFSLSNEITHVGCYDVTLSTTYSYTTVVKPLLTWKICVSLCTNQVTVYAGIDANNFTCFCGNHIAELSTVTEDSKCNFCHEDPSKYCGGSGTMSLYQLRAKTKIPTTLLLATNRGIEIFSYSPKTYVNDEQYHIVTLQLLNAGASSVAYNFLKQDIYYVSSNKIFKMAYVPVLMTYYHPMLLIETNCSQVVDLSLDWVLGKIYWACYPTRKIHFANFHDGSDVQGPLSNIYDLQHIRIEPLMNCFFFDSQKKLGVYNFTRTSSDVLNEYGFKETLQISIDIQQEAVYVIGSYTSGSSRKYLISTNYNRTVFKVVYSGPELSNPFTLDVFNGTVIWGSQNSTDYTLYSGSMTSKCELEDVKIIYSGGKKIKTINDIKIYGPEVQLPSRRYLCKEKNCSHSCSLVSASLVRCSCPESMVLSGDSRTCIGSVNTSITEAEDTSGTPNSTETDTSVSQTDKNDEIDTVEPTKSSLEPRLQVFDSHQKLFYIAVFMCVPILVVLVIFQVYVYMMMKKSNGNFFVRYSKRSDNLQEPTYSEPRGGTCNLYT